MAAYLRRTLSDEDRAAAEQHLEECDACRQLLADVAWSSDAGESEAPHEGMGSGGDEASTTSDIEVTIGTTIGRYVVLRELGSGGFGVVFMAYDPKLDRRIALKVVPLYRLGVGRETEDRILREAQAMARLSHSNVTAVYDVSTWKERACIAMELVEGMDARTWLSEPRERMEVLEAFAQAGRGLAAAHQAGLVHRDFKPANMLIGDDGRVSVTDFGLARLRAPAERPEPEPRPADPSLSPSPSPSALEASLTAAGAMVGTPRYMAPEQHRGEPATARSDQFSFCLALAESLCGQHPFEFDEPWALPEAVLEGRLRVSALRRLPAWIRQPLRRGLSLDPEARFPSLEPLLAALSPRRRRARRRRWQTAAVGLLLATIPAAWMYDSRRAESDACTGGQAKVDEVFGPSRQQALAAAFEASTLPYAATSWSTTQRSVEQWLDAWQAQYTEACQSARRQEQSQEVLTARMLCLDGARDELGYMLDTLTRGGDRGVRQAVHSVQSLADLDRCADVEALLTQAPHGPEQRLLVAGVRATLTRARAVAIAGDVAASLTLGKDAVARAREAEHAPTTADALIQLGRGLVMSGEPKAAEPVLREAVVQASEGRHDRAAAEAWIDLLFVVGSLAQRRERAVEVELASEAALARLDGHWRLRARQASARGLLRAQQGDYEEAVVAQRQALELLEAEHGLDAVQVGVQLHRVAEVMVEQGRAAEAQPLAERSLSILARTYGPGHPRVALPLTVLARCACLRDEHARCVELAEEAVKIRLGGRQQVDPAILPIMLVHAEGLLGTGRAEDALEALGAARQLAYEHHGPASAWAGLADAALADALVDAGRIDEAKARAGAAVTTLESVHGSSHPDARRARAALTRALAAVSNPKEDAMNDVLMPNSPSEEISTKE